MAHPHETHLRPKIIGARVQRVEDPRLLRGLGSYVDDRQIARVLHVAFRRSDHSHARIGSIDCSKALAAPGVAAVLTADDLNGLVQPLYATSRMAGYHATPIFPLARGKVRHVGEPVAAVLAGSRYHRSSTRSRRPSPVRRSCMKRPARTYSCTGSSSVARWMR